MELHVTGPGQPFFNDWMEGAGYTWQSVLVQIQTRAEQENPRTSETEP
jgi:hypothetical protein